jgi:WD40 repeat protein
MFARDRFLQTCFTLILLLSIVGCETSCCDDGPDTSAGRAPKSVTLSPGGDVSSLAFFPDGQMLATDCGPRLWDLQSDLATVSEPLTKGRSGWAEWMAFSPDGHYLATISEMHDLRQPRAILELWRLGEGHKLSQLWEVPCADYFRQSQAFHIAFSPDSSAVAFGSPDETVHIWDPTSGRGKLKFKGGVAVTYSLNGKELIAVRHDGAIRRIEAATGKPLSEDKRGHNPDFLYVEWASFSQDGRRVAISDGHVVLVKDTETGENLTRIELELMLSKAFAGSSLLLSPDGETLVVRIEGELIFFAATTGQERGRMNGQAGPIGAFAFSDDGSMLAWVERSQGNDLEKTTVCIRTVADLSLGGRVPTRPPELPLKSELIVGNGEYILDLKGMTPEQFSNAEFEKRQRPAPDVNWSIRLTNTGKQTITLRKLDFLWPSFIVSGPGVINETSSCQYAGIFSSDERITLGPGASHSLPIKSLQSCGICSVCYHYLVMPGEYSVQAGICVVIAPAPEGTHIDSEGFGWLTVRTGPAHVTVRANSR